MSSKTKKTSTKKTSPSLSPGELEIVEVQAGAISQEMIVKKYYTGRVANYDIAIRKKRMVLSPSGQAKLKVDTGSFILLSQANKKLLIAARTFQMKDGTVGFKLGAKSKGGLISISSNSFTENLTGEYRAVRILKEPATTASRNQSFLFWLELELIES